jgi:hypothetical protein
MKSCCCIELPTLRRTFALVGYSEIWRSSLQQTICDTLKARINSDGSVDIEAHFKSNGGIKISFSHMPIAIVWEA